MTTPRTLRAGMMLSQADVEAINSALKKLADDCDRMEDERDSARRELEALKKDKERLDWLESDEGSMQPVMRLIRKHGEVGESLTFRQAIDAAMRKET